MVLDTSALVSVLFKETGFDRLEQKILAAERVLIGAPIVFEAAIIAKRDTRAAIDVPGFLRSMDAEVVPFDERHYQSAFSAFLRFGKGRHAARLNILDCMSYAVADVANLPLLYVGDDFAKTDIEAA